MICKIPIPTILYNLCTGELYEHALKEDNTTI